MKNQQNPTLEEIASIVVDCSYKLHVEAGPGLLESVYETTLAHLLKQRGLTVERQVPVPITLFGIQFDEGFRADLIVNDVFIVELKSVETVAPVHAKQLLTYLKLCDFRLGLLINFGCVKIKDGIKRIANNHFEQDINNTLD